MEAQEIVQIINALPMGGIIFAASVLGVALPMIYYMARYEYQKLSLKGEIVREMTAQNRPQSEIQQAIKLLD